MSRTSQAVGFALAALLVPASAHAQDASVLVLLAGPPFLLAPVVAVAIRHAWMRRVPGSRFSARSGLALSILEFFLWLLATWFAAVVYFRESWVAALVLAALLAGIVSLNRRLAPPQRSLMFSIALAAVFPTVWFVAQLVWYGGVLLWERLRLTA